MNDQPDRSVSSPPSSDGLSGGAKVAGGIGALILAALAGLARHADDLGRGVIRHADDFGRGAANFSDDLGRGASHLGDDLSRSVPRFGDDLTHSPRFGDDLAHTPRFGSDLDPPSQLGNGLPPPTLGSPQSRPVAGVMPVGESSGPILSPSGTRMVLRGGRWILLDEQEDQAKQPGPQ
jgi:hypothetical protein